VKRREFITLLGGAAVAWPLVARAQEPERMRRIGLLMAINADDAEAQARIAAFVRGLQQWVGALEKTSASITAWPVSMPTPCAKMRPNWSHSPQT
jgi:putative ABC transport system substrate-binding protein